MYCARDRLVTRPTVLSTPLAGTPSPMIFRGYLLGKFERRGPDPATITVVFWTQKHAGGPSHFVSAGPGGSGRGRGTLPVTASASRQMTPSHHATQPLLTVPVTRDRTRTIQSASPSPSAAWPGRRAAATAAVSGLRSQGPVGGRRH